MPIKHVQEKEKKRNVIVNEKNIFLSQLLFNCNIKKTKIMIFCGEFVSWAYMYFG